jgi:hypothetical protein
VSDAMPKFRVMQEIVVEAENPEQAAVTANAMIRSSNVGRYDVIDEAGYTFHVSLEDGKQVHSDRSD